MKKHGVILFPRASGWIVGIVAEGSCTLTEVADEAAVVASLQTRELEPAVWLALPSRECLAARISTCELPRRGRDLAMRYRLEEQIPWAAEEMSTSFISPDESGGVLAVAVQTQTLDERIESLRASGIEVLGASPAMLLAAANLMREMPCDAILLRDETVEEGEWISLIVLAQGAVAEWLLLPAEASEVVERLRQVQLNGTRQVIACGLTAQWRAMLEASTDLRVIDHTESATELACREAVRVMDREELALADLRARPGNAAAFQTALMIIVALLVALCIGLLWRMHRYDALRDHYEAASAATFQRLFPGSPMPAGVVSRLLGEARLLRSKAGSDAEMPQAMSLSPRLAKALLALDALPPGVRFAVSDLRVEGDRLTVSGNVATLGDVDTLADAIRGTGDWIVSPPHSEQLSGDISFTIEGTSSTESKPSGGESP